jgi:hypothetical protein
MTTATKMLDGLLIDPFRQELRRVRVAHDLDTWYGVLCCDNVDVCCLASNSLDGAALDIWFDDEFTFKEPIWPGFLVKSARSTGSQTHVLHGYGLVFASNREGTSISLSSSRHSVEWFARATGLAFENWKLRTDEEFIGQVIRTPETELGGRFEYLKD